MVYSSSTFESTPESFMQRYHVVEVVGPAIAVLAVAICVGCSSASGPSQAEIRSALDQIAAATKGFWNCGRVPGAHNASPTVTSFTPKGTSVEGTTAKVL